MTIYEQINRFDKLIEFIQRDLPTYASEVAANDLVALITNRVINEGKDHKGISFSSYSENKMSASRLFGKSRTQTGERKVRALAKSKTALSYKEFREINNLKTDKKNFEFSGEMFRKFGVIKKTNDLNGFQMTIGGMTPEAQRKIDENSEQEKQSIIEASSGEGQIIESTFKSWLNKNAERILNE